ncbi:nucleotidyltransferase family protein [Sphingomonas sp. SRS2]|uniref:nucleotidyltransferase family protein n=1 Tax=Sphingomonas sp. SRS2 TaxID=133190 RepID=UPI000618465C|nr:nucleotidyltransferase family protein [Sphingomonas sp. SRS2]KKC26399.1 hypothetical protein WP12_08695 [Sphingomonas sp. SRS2]
MTVGAILLAAGSARRMGEDKLLADLYGKALILHAFDAIIAAGLANPIVAVAPNSPVIPLIEGRATPVEVADHALGMGHSLAAAVRAAPSDWTAAIICLGDMPFVQPDTLIQLAGDADEGGILQPVFEGRPGNPLLWGRAHFARLANLTGDQGGRTLLQDYRATLVEVADPGIGIDIDTPKALANARLERP